MKAILAADLHGSDDTPEELGFFLKLLDDACRLAKANDAKHVIIAGDFLHHKNKFSVNLFLAVYNKLLWMAQQGVNVIIERGNHDTMDWNNPTNTHLQLFSKVATIINETVVVEESNCIIAFVPWFLPDRYREEVARAATAVSSVAHKPKVLFTHVSLQEGKISPSNQKLMTPIKLEHLLPGIWDGGIYLGDYHAHQWLPGKTACYLGAPRHRTFGDFDCLGMWLWDSTYPTKLELLKLPSRYPEYITWRIDRLDDLRLPGYDSRNKNRIYVAGKVLNEVSTLYHDAKILLAEEYKPAVVGRISKEEVMDPWQVAKKWAEEMRKLDAEHLKELYALFH